MFSWSEADISQVMPTSSSTRWGAVLRLQKCAILPQVLLGSTTLTKMLPGCRSADKKQAVRHCVGTGNQGSGAVLTQPASVHMVVQSLKWSMGCMDCTQHTTLAHGKITALMGWHILYKVGLAAGLGQI